MATRVIRGNTGGFNRFNIVFISALIQESNISADSAVALFKNIMENDYLIESAVIAYPKGYCGHNGKGNDSLFAPFLKRKNGAINFLRLDMGSEDTVPWSPGMRVHIAPTEQIHRQTAFGNGYEKPQTCK